MVKLFTLSAVLISNVALTPVEANPVMLDIDARSPFRFRSICVVDSKRADSLYHPRPIGAMRTRDNELYLQALPQQTTTLKSSYKGVAYKGMTLLLVNSTNIEEKFESTDGQLWIYQEALDAKGHWQRIEYWFTSGCGNSFYTVPLQPHSYCSFDVPRYTGSFQTKLRFRLHTARDEVGMVSNEFEGSVIPGQFVQLRF